MSPGFVSAPLSFAPGRMSRSPSWASFAPAKWALHEQINVFTPHFSTSLVERFEIAAKIGDGMPAAASCGQTKTKPWED
jgi:hypothetical protein